MHWSCVWWFWVHQRDPRWVRSFQEDEAQGMGHSLVLLRNSRLYFGKVPIFFPAILSSAGLQQGVLHWVAQPSPGVDPLKIEVRLFEKLFTSEVIQLLLWIPQTVWLDARVCNNHYLALQNPAELEDNWLSDLNPNSKEIIPEAYAVPSLASAALGDRFQFERLGNPPFS